MRATHWIIKVDSNVVAVERLRPYLREVLANRSENLDSVCSRVSQVGAWVSKDGRIEVTKCRDAELYAHTAGRLHRSTRQGNTLHQFDTDVFAYLKGRKVF